MIKSITLRFKKKIFDYLSRSKIIKLSGFKDRTLFQLSNGLRFWLSLNESAYIDKCLRLNGKFEIDSTNIVKSLIKQSDVVVDIGANIGYYSILASKIVGKDGRVLAFEPTKYFCEVLEKNISENRCDNISVFNLGLSDKEQTLEIQIGDSSASLHNPVPKQDIFRESINLITFDEIVQKLNLSKIDFIKVDIDGHEPAFLKGAIKSIRKFKPKILLEISHLNYLEYGVTAWEFYEFLKAENFKIYSELNLKEITNRVDFLKECGNFNFSANILLAYDSI